MGSLYLGVVRFYMKVNLAFILRHLSYVCISHEQNNVSYINRKHCYWCFELYLHWTSGTSA
jgi:hypothetical protein